MLKKSNKNIWKFSVLIIAILRIFTPALIFQYPTTTAILNIVFLDGVDGFVFSQAGWNRKIYLTYDKLIDYWWYGFIVLYFWGNPLLPIFAGLFLFRSFGHWMSIITKKEGWLFYFPAIIEIYFIGYLISKDIPQLGYLYKNEFVYISLLISTLISLVREYIIHVAKRSLGKALVGVGPRWSK